MNMHGTERFSRNGGGNIDIVFNGTGQDGRTYLGQVKMEGKVTVLVFSTRHFEMRNAIVQAGRRKGNWEDF